MLGLQTPARCACLVGSQPGCLKGVTGTGVAIVRPWSKWSKVAPQRFQCVPLLIDFTHRAHTAPSEERDRWAPKGMLKQESRDDDRHREEALIDKDAQEGVYRNTPEADLFLDKSKPSYVGGLLEMANSRLYGFWGSRTEALRTGELQNEAKHGSDF